TFEYNLQGLTNYADPLGKVTRYVRDATGQTLRQTNAENQTIQFTYNPSGEVLTLTDGNGNVTHWNYDQYGLTTNKVDANNAEMFRYQYDPNGQLTNRLQAGSITPTYRYDAWKPQKYCLSDVKQHHAWLRRSQSSNEHDRWHWFNGFHRD